MLLIFLSSAAAEQKQDSEISPLDKVLKLNRGNFDRALREHKQLLVHFCKSRRETHRLVSGHLDKRAGDGFIFYCGQILL